MLDEFQSPVGSVRAQVLFGTSNGQILVSDMHGEVVAQVTLVEDAAIVAMAWSCEKFKMEEADEEQRSEAVPPTQGRSACRRGLLCHRCNATEQTHDDSRWRW